MISLDRFAGERGSIPMALLAVIVVSSVVSVVTTRTIAESRNTQFDNEYATVLHVAEAGLDHALFRLNAHLEMDDDDDELSGSGTVDGLAFTWTAERQPDDSWLAESTGTGWNGVERTLVAEIRDQPIFSLSLATHLGVNFSGANSADSYDSTVAPASYCSYGKSPSAECFGIVASNGPVNLQGASNVVDRVHIHDWANNQDNRCTRNQNPNFCESPYRLNFDDPLDIQAQIPLVENLIETHCPDAPPNWTASTTPTTMNPFSSTQFPLQATAAMVPINGKDAHVRCVNDLVFSQHTTTTLATTITIDEPLVLLVTGRIVLGQHSVVHCPACASGQGPRARRLTIFSLSTDPPAGANTHDYAVEIRNQAKIGAGIYAPNGTCGNKTPGAGTEIFGSIVCSDLANKGGWKFHYDEDLASGFTTGLYFVSRWSEV